MRLLRLRLRDFRGVADLEVAFAARGVTVVEGPNEAGKTSLLEAFALVRELPDSSRAARVLAVRPVGSDVGPSVEVELETGPYRLVLAKRWLRSPSTELRVLAPRPEQLSGRAAHDRFVAILDETLDRQVLDALQLAQGEGLDQPDLAHVEPLHAALVADTPEPVDVDGRDPLVAAVAAELGRYRTPRTGRPRDVLRAATDTESAARGRVDHLAAELASARSLADRHAEARAALPAHRERLAAATSRHTGAVADARGLETAREAAEGARELLDKATRQLLDAEQARDTRGRLADEVVEREVALAAARDDLEPATGAADRATAAAEAAALVSETARGRLELAERAHARARLRTDLLDARERVEVLTRRTTRVRAALAEEHDARAALRARPFPATALADVERATQEVEVAERARLAAAPTLELERLDDGTTVRVDGSSVPASWSAPVLEPTTVEVPGARLVLRPGEAGVLDAELTAARRHLQQILVLHAVDDLDAARAARAEHERLERVLASAEQSLAVALDGATPEAVVADLESAVARLARRAPDDPTDDLADQPVEAGETVEALRTAADDARRACDEARDAQDHAREAAHGAARRLVAVQREAEHAASELTRARTTLSRARAVVADDDLAAALADARRENDEQRAAAERAAEALARLQPQALDHARAEATREVDAAQRALREAEDETVALAARLDAARDRGTWEEHDAAVAEHGRTVRALAETTARADAAALLLDRLTSRRDAVRAGYVRPFTRALEALGERVFGPGFGVEVTPALRIATRTLDGRTVPFDQLSAGAREQLGILGRLACASLVSPDDGAPVVLDDALGFADPERLAAVAAVVAAAGQQAQVVVLTCQPDRYRDIEAAATVRLGA